MRSERNRDGLKVHRRNKKNNTTLFFYKKIFWSKQQVAWGGGWKIKLIFIIIIIFSEFNLLLYIPNKYINRLKAHNVFKFRSGLNIGSLLICGGIWVFISIRCVFSISSPSDLRLCKIFTSCVFSILEPWRADKKHTTSKTKNHITS